MGRGGSAVRTWVARSYARTRARGGGGQRKSPCEARSGTVSSRPGGYWRGAFSTLGPQFAGAYAGCTRPADSDTGTGRRQGAMRTGSRGGPVSWRGRRRHALPGRGSARPGPARASAPGSAWGKGFPEPSGARILGAGGRPCPRRPPAGRQLPGEAQGRRPFGGPPGAPGVHRGDSACLSGTSVAAAPVRGGRATLRAPARGNRMGRRCGAGAAAPRAPPPDGTAAGRGGWNASCSPGFVAPGRVCPRRQEKFLE